MKSLRQYFHISAATIILALQSIGITEQELFKKLIKKEIPLFECSIPYQISSSRLEKVNDVLYILGCDENEIIYIDF